MNSVTLITSAAYVNQELTAEFGPLPPAFLPIGQGRLYELQISKLSSCRIYLTIPESYAAPERDTSRLKALGVELIAIPDNLRLGEAIVYAINFIGASDTSVQILHGDTLVEQLPTGATDVIGVGDSSGGYAWAEVTTQQHQVVSLRTVESQFSNNDNQVACGYFAFSSAALLVRSITRARGDFIEGINLYVAEKPVAIADIGVWLDFGHLQTFFHSRRTISTSRSFNTITIDGHTARKRSADTAKIEAESAWLANIPPAIQIYTARLIEAGINAGQAFHVTEYEYLPTLSELFVFGALDKTTWESIIGCCHEFLSACSNVHGMGGADAALRELSLNKTNDRLEHFAKETGFDLDRELRVDGIATPSARRLAEEAAALINFASGQSQTIMHGDFCFSNILYNSRVHRVKVIDARGYVFPGRPSIFGDFRYDIAKIAHSILGRYDQIIAGRYDGTFQDPYRLSISFEQANHHSWLEFAFGNFEDFDAFVEWIQRFTGS